MSARPQQPQLGVVGVGDYLLEVGDPAGLAIEPRAQRDQEDVEALTELSEALAAEDDARAAESGPVEAGARLVDEASATTSKVEEAVAIGEGLAAGKALDLAQLGVEVNVALGLLERLDRDGRWHEQLRLARALANLFALLRRWSALLRSLRAALRAGEALKDPQAIGWAKHQLGTLKVVAGDVGGAAQNLGEAREIRQRGGSDREIELTDRSLRALCHQMNRGSPWDKRRILRISVPLAVLAALLLLFAGGIAGGVVGRRTANGDGKANGKAVGEIGPDGRVLEVKLEGSGSGAVLSKPTGIECPPDCAEAFRKEDMVTLTAKPGNGSVFDRFSGDCEGDSPCTLRVTGAKSVAAVFTATPILTVEITGNGGAFGEAEGTETTLSCHVEDNEVSEGEERLPQAGDSCQRPFPLGSVVALTVEADRGWEAKPPSGCDEPEGETCTVTMNTSRTVTVTFTPFG